MKRVKFQLGAIGIIVVSMLTFSPFVPVAAEEAAEPIAGAPKLFISQFKIGGSGNQFFEIFNNSGVEVDMASVQLAYFNHYDMAEASSNKLVSLSGKLPAGGYYIVNDSALTVCYQALVANASLGFNNTNGLVQLLEFSPEDGRYVSSLLDQVAWNKSKVSGMPDVVPTLTDPAKSYRRNLPLPTSGTAWSPMYFDGTCSPVVEELSDVEESGLAYSFLTGALPPVRYVAAVSDGKAQTNRNVGRAAPIINEVLPNPESPQTDASDEFIELYNPNDSVFDLTGFKLAFGSANPRKYTFPEGTLLQPKEFKAFTSGETSISLSNSGAQVWLLDPAEQIIGQSDPYQNAKDGQAWVLDGGRWLWTLQPTPNAMNAIAKAVTASEKGKAAAATLGIGSTGSTSAGVPAAGGADTAAELDDAAPLHPGVLAAIGAGALAYTLYEYRQDLSNRVFQLRRYLRRRQALRREM